VTPDLLDLSGALQGIQTASLLALLSFASLAIGGTLVRALVTERGRAEQWTSRSNPSDATSDVADTEATPDHHDTADAVAHAPAVGIAGLRARLVGVPDTWRSKDRPWAG
jgi:hypothetical protein